jgi:hypothetical protein
MEFRGAPKGPDATEVDIAFRDYVWYLEAFEKRDTIVYWVIVVPLVTEAVQKYGDIGELCVVVDDEPVNVHSDQFHFYTTSLYWKKSRC